MQKKDLFQIEKQEDDLVHVDSDILKRILSTIEDQSKKVIIETLHKDPALRKKNEIQQLIDNTALYPFFESYISAGQSDIHTQCCKRMKLAVQSKDQIVFQDENSILQSFYITILGEFGQYFYLILHGRVSVSIKMPGQQYQIQYKGQIDGTDANLENIINSIDQTVAVKNRMRSETIPMDNLLQVSTLGEGFQFGEMALLNNQPRLATIKCLEDCIFAVLGKQDFKQILKQNEEEKLYKQMCYFSSLPFFVSWNINMLKNLFLNSRRKSYLKDQYIFQEGDLADSVYIIRNGDFEQSKKFSRLQNIDGLNLDADEIKVFDENEHLNQFELKKKDMKICVLDEKTMIGEEDIIRENERRTFSVKCVSLVGLAIRIDKNEFQYRVMLEESSKICILKQLQIKDSALQIRMKDIQQRLQQYQNYFYQNSKHKEYLRNKIESQSSKLFQSNFFQKKVKINSNVKGENKNENNKYIFVKQFNEKSIKTSIPQEVSSFTEAVQATSKRINRSQSQYLSQSQLGQTPYSEPADTFQKNYMNLYHSNNFQSTEGLIREDKIPNPPEQNIFKPQQNQKNQPQFQNNQDLNFVKHLFNFKIKIEKKVRAISSNDLNILTILKLSLQDQKQRKVSHDQSNSNEYKLQQRIQPLDELKRPRLLYGNIEQQLKQNFKKVFQKKLREKGKNTEIQEIPTWNKVSMSFANSILNYRTEIHSKQRSVSAYKKKDQYESAFRATTSDLQKDFSTIQDQQDIPIQTISKIEEQKIKRKSIRSTSNPKTLIKVMRNFQTSQQNHEQSKLVSFNVIQDESDTKNTGYLRSLDYASISRIHYSPKKNNSLYKSTLKIKKKF